jgi:hypothetical protein
MSYRPITFDEAVILTDAKEAGPGKMLGTCPVCETRNALRINCGSSDTNLMVCCTVKHCHWQQVFFELRALYENAMRGVPQ